MYSEWIEALGDGAIVKNKQQQNTTNNELFVGFLWETVLNRNILMA